MSVADRHGAALDYPHPISGDSDVSVLTHITCSFADASAFVRTYHRHHTPSVGHKFSIAALRDGAWVGVVVVGRPVSRFRDDGMTLEVTRLCVLDDQPNACSFLYGKAAKAALALGYARIGTYILKSEPGTSLKAAGWQCVAEVKGRSWSCVSRPRTDKHPTTDKLLWETGNAPIPTPLSFNLYGG